MHCEPRVRFPTLDDVVFDLVIIIGFVFVVCLSFSMRLCQLLVLLFSTPGKLIGFTSSFPFAFEFLSDTKA